VAVINGSTLFVFNRYNGKLLWQTKLDGAPGAGPALSQQRVYAPLLDGRLVSYRLLPVKEDIPEAAKSEVLTPEQRAARDQARLESLRLDTIAIPPLYASVPGRAVIQPLVTREDQFEENVVWATDAGYLCAGRIDRTEQKALELRFRLHTDAPIVAQPSYLPPDANVIQDSGLVIAGSEDGFVYAIRERNGEQLWRFSTGEPIVEDPVVLGRFVFVTNQLGGMYCVDAKTGSQAWWTPEVTRFIAASKERVYATDKVGLLHVLSADTGAEIDTIAASMLPIKLTNPENDRLFLANATGLIQCLHEPGVAQPLVRKIPTKEIEPTSKLASSKAASKKEKEAASEEGSPAPTQTAKSKPSGGGGGGSSKAGAKGKKAGAGDFAGAGGAKKKKAKGGDGGGMAQPGFVPGGAGAGAGAKKKKM
jgi:outer membrane protein assembly factor BamB